MASLFSLEMDLVGRRELSTTFRAGGRLSKIELSALAVSVAICILSMLGSPFPPILVSHFPRCTQRKDPILPNLSIFFLSNDSKDGRGMNR